MSFYDDYMPLRWDKIVSALKQAGTLLKQENCIREYDEMKWSYLYPAIAEREHTFNPLGRYHSPYLDWNKVVSAIEYAASLLLKENYNVEHEEVKNRYLTDAINMRDTYLFLIGKESPTGAKAKSGFEFNWVQYTRPSTIFSSSDRRKLLKQALSC